MIPIVDTGDHAWRDKASCKDRPGMWDYDAAPEDHEEALRICRDECPVRKQCAAYAKATRPDGGIWGGELRKNRTEREGSVQCNECGKVCANPGALNMHATTHKTHCAQGHDLTLPGARVPVGGKRNTHQCRECKREIEARRPPRSSRRKGRAAA